MVKKTHLMISRAGFLADITAQVLLICTELLLLRKRFQQCFIRLLFLLLPGLIPVHWPGQGCVGVTAPFPVGESAGAILAPGGPEQICTSTQCPALHAQQHPAGGCSPEYHHHSVVQEGDPWGWYPQCAPARSTAWSPHSSRAVASPGHCHCHDRATAGHTYSPSPAWLFLAQPHCSFSGVP